MTHTSVTLCGERKVSRFNDLHRQKQKLTEKPHHTPYSQEISDQAQEEQKQARTHSHHTNDHSRHSTTLPLPPPNRSQKLFAHTGRKFTARAFPNHTHPFLFSPTLPLPTFTLCFFGVPVHVLPSSALYRWHRVSQRERDRKGLRHRRLQPLITGNSSLTIKRHSQVRNTRRHIINNSQHSPPPQNPNPLQHKHHTNRVREK